MINVIAIAIKDAESRLFSGSTFRGIPLAGVEIVIEIGIIGRNPIKVPPHLLPVLLNFVQGPARNDFERDITLRQVIPQSVVIVGPEGTTGTRVPARGKHEMIDEELGFVAEEVGEGFVSVDGVENVVFVDFDPGERLDLFGEFVFCSGHFFFLLEEFVTGFDPFLAGDDLVVGR